MPKNRHDKVCRHWCDPVFEAVKYIYILYFTVLKQTLQVPFKITLWVSLYRCEYSEKKSPMKELQFSCTINTADWLQLFISRSFKFLYCNVFDQRFFVYYPEKLHVELLRHFITCSQDDIVMLRKIWAVQKDHTSVIVMLSKLKSGMIHPSCPRTCSVS
jgi:hypothetical protein